VHGSEGLPARSEVEKLNGERKSPAERAGLGSLASLRHLAPAGVGQRMPSPLADLIVLDTLGKLRAHGHGIGGYCLVCQRIFDVSRRAPREPERSPKGST
jgi:hypothetical protein